VNAPKCVCGRGTNTQLVELPALSLVVGGLAAPSTIPRPRSPPSASHFGLSGVRLSPSGMHTRHTWRQELRCRRAACLEQWSGLLARRAYFIKQFQAWTQNVFVIHVPSGVQCELCQLRYTNTLTYLITIISAVGFWCECHWTSQNKPLPAFNSLLFACYLLRWQ